MGLLPVRGKRRVFGPRRTIIPYRWLGRISLAIGAATFVVSSGLTIFGGHRVGDAGPGIFTGSILIGLGGYWLALGRRLKAAPVTLTHDIVEGSVLYLRAFNTENRPFVTGPRSKLRWYTDKPGVQIPQKGDRTINVTFEEFFGDAISKRIGAFIGLGSPSDNLPPAGAVREYAEDAAWKTRLIELANSARCILLNVGDSDNLQWELAQIRQMGASRKLCIFTSPRNFQKSVRAVLQAEDGSREALVHAWRSTTEVLGHAGFECEPRCPGFGAALSFDEAGKSELLTTDAGEPDDFVKPLTDWITSGTKTGKCIPATCNSCGSSTYVSPNCSQASPGILCFICAQKAQLSSMGFFKRALGEHPILSYMYGGFCLLIVLTASDALQVPIPGGFIGTLVVTLPLICIPWGLSAGVRRLKTGSFKVRPADPQSSQPAKPDLAAPGGQTVSE